MHASLIPFLQKEMQNLFEALQKDKAQWHKQVHAQKEELHREEAHLQKEKAEWLQV